MKDGSRTVRWTLGLAVAWGVSVWAPAPGLAQDKRASIAGRVVSSADKSPVAGVRVNLLAPRKFATTDSVGRFLFDNLKPGAYQLEALMLGFGPLSALVKLEEGERKELEFRTDSVGQLLPTIYVDGEAQPVALRELTKFERRMATGSGRFITREQILQRKPMRILDLIRFLPNVRMNCYGLGCQVRLNRDPRNCGPAVFVDGIPTSMAVLEATNPNDVHGIEVYRGPSETPPEINNEAARCGGAIAIWTRRGMDP